MERPDEKMPEREPPSERTPDAARVSAPGTTAPVTRTTIPPSHLAHLTAADVKPWASLKHDLRSAVVVALVALPLCLGIAVASGAPPLSGLITGIVGGVIVSWVSGASLAVSGPAAGLTVIVLSAIGELGFAGMLLATVLAGVMQVIFGLLRAGIFAYYFPSNVIKGMLAAIGLILILKQVPHALGFEGDYEGDLSFIQPDQRNTFTELLWAFAHPALGAVIIALVGLFLLITLDRPNPGTKRPALPAPLLAVVVGVGLNELFGLFAPSLALSGEHLVNLPDRGWAALVSELRFPAGDWLDPAIWRSAFTIAAVASIETLLCVEAIDKLDPFKRVTPVNRELVAQGVGNILAASIGGIPMTAVIVRGSANIQSGGRTRMSSFVHGLLLLCAVLLLPWLLNRVPLAALAAVLIHVGYRLASPRLFWAMLRKPVDQWAPFVVPVVAILLTDLLTGVAIGMAVGVFFVLWANLRTPYFIHHREVHQPASYRRPHAGKESEGATPASGGAELPVVGPSVIRIQLSENVSFLNKASVNKVLHELPEGSLVEIDGTFSQYIHPDVLEIIHEFGQTAHIRGIQLTLIDVPAPDDA